MHRSLLEKPIFTNDKLLKIWIWCLLKASHKQHFQIVGRQKVELRPGEFIFGRFAAAEELGMPPTTVRDYMYLLRNNGSIVIKSANKYSLVSIDNWELYQSHTNNTAIKSATKSTADGQQMDTDKNGKNDKNNRIYTYSSSQMLLAEKLRDLIIKNNLNAKVPSKLEQWANEIRLMIERDSRQEADIEKVIVWCQQDAFWKTNILSTKKLREKYDQLFLQMRRHQSQGEERHGKSILETGFGNGRSDRSFTEYDQ